MNGGRSNGGTRIHIWHDFTSLAAATAVAAAFLLRGLSYDVISGVRKRVICEDSWDVRCSAAFQWGA
jgi:hypothetical protein